MGGIFDFRKIEVSQKIPPSVSKLPDNMGFGRSKSWNNRSGRSIFDMFYILLSACGVAAVCCGGGVFADVTTVGGAE